MSIPFTQFLRPDGRQRPTEITRPADVEDAAKRLIAAGYKFEIEELQTLQISMEICDEEDSLAAAICLNGPQVPIAVDKMIADATKELALRISQSVAKSENL